MDLFSVLTLIGGLALFLFGMNYMGDSLKKLSGSKLEMILSKLTSNRFKGFLLGFGVTAVIQSSSATMVMLVGFVNSGIMKLAQTTSVLMGANIGTTVTGWLLSTAGISGSNIVLQLLKPSSFTPVLAVVGIVFNMFSKSDKRKNVGSILLGFAILMFGMETMSSATEGLQDSPLFMDLLVKLSNPFLGIVAGTLFTAIIQSSSASVGILQALSLTSVIPISSALPVILGMNIGAALPPILSSISGNRDAKRVAASCVYIKIISVLATVAVIYGLNAVFSFEFLGYRSSTFSIAFMHTAFNVVSTAALMPFCKVIEKLSEMTFKGGSSSQPSDVFESLDVRFLNYPAFATEQARELTVQMAHLTEESVNTALSLTTEYSDKSRELIKKQEETIDMYEDRLDAYLVALTGRQITISESLSISTLLHIISYVERISDHACKLSDTAKEMSKRNIELSKSATAEIKVISNAVSEIVGLTVTAIRDKDIKPALRIESLSRVITALSREMRTNHLTRVQNNECNTEFGFVFSNLLNNLVRIADHCQNIAVYILQQEESSTFSLHEYKSQMHGDDKSLSQNYFDDYVKKYTLA